MHRFFFFVFFWQKCPTAIRLGQQEASAKIPMKVSSLSALAFSNIKYESVLTSNLQNSWKLACPW